MNAQHVRFSGADWYNDDMPEVTIGGVGGIGSWLTVLLSRIGVPMYIHDMDTVDETNYAGQLYPITAMGSYKEDAIIDMAKLVSSEVDITKMGEFTDDDFTCAITFSAFDNMKARKLMFEAWKRNPDKELFIDGRMLMEQGMVFCVTPDNIDEYEKTLFDDSEVVAQPCSAKATSHSGACIGSLMVAIFTNYLTNKKLNFDIREVPFRFDYNYHLMMFSSSDNSNGE
jgi:molybdopterin/thiamine biosynthesis adenylyltransferase